MASSARLNSACYPPGLFIVRSNAVCACLQAVSTSGFVVHQQMDVSAPTRKAFARCLGVDTKPRRGRKSETGGIYPVLNGELPPFYSVE